jgi:nucleotide-binding universal stress UspA family protein
LFERIIVPLDGSRLSAQAIPYAAEIGKKFDAEIILVRVLAESGLPTIIHDGGTPNSSIADIIAQESTNDVENAASAKRYLMNWAQSLKTQGLKASYQVSIGMPAKSINELAKAQQASLIVMMSHGRGWLKRALMGSVATELVQTSAVPVLVIRAKDIESK